MLCTNSFLCVYLCLSCPPLCFREQQLSRAIFVTDGPITDQDEGVSAFYNYVSLKTMGGDNVILVPGMSILTQEVYTTVLIWV